MYREFDHRDVLPPCIHYVSGLHFAFSQRPDLKLMAHVLPTAHAQYSILCDVFIEKGTGGLRNLTPE